MQCVLGREIIHERLVSTSFPHLFHWSICSTHFYSSTHVVLSNLARFQGWTVSWSLYSLSLLARCWASSAIPCRAGCDRSRGVSPRSSPFCTTIPSVGTPRRTLVIPSRRSRTTRISLESPVFQFMPAISTRSYCVITSIVDLECAQTKTIGRVSYPFFFAGQTVPSPSNDYVPQDGRLLGCVSGELGIRKYLEENGHELVVTSSKDGDSCELDKHLADAEIVISQVNWKKVAWYI